jgi:D-alanyl-D-alanine carboxypeptidase/D-alanyl-D-alanine-endopeptidase (penicillin-binding protein 4)
MKKLILLLCLCITTKLLANPKAPDKLTNKINQLIQEFGNSAGIGIQISDPKTGKTLYQKDADHYFMPASNEKLFTAAAALNSLTDDFNFKTQLFVNMEKVQNGVLNDNIYLTFSGDPSLTFAQLDQLINKLSQAGIQQIQGKIIIDDTAFDQMTMSPGSTWDDKDYCWGSPVHAIIVEHNCVTATLTPNAVPSQPANLILPPYPQSLQFINSVITQPTLTECLIETKRAHPNYYTVSGCINMSSKPQEIAMAIDDPRNNLQYILKNLFIKNHILSSDDFEYKTIDIPTSPFASIFSPSLTALVTSMLKNSDNIIANSLFKTMGAQFAKEPGSFQNGSAAVRSIINQATQIDIPKTTLIDGSGASRYNFLTPQQIVTLLQKMYASKQATTFMQALPIAGVDGTLKERMLDTATLGKVYAKTGTETAVSTLSGYIITHKNETLTFSIMINSFVDLPKRYQDLQDKICTAIIENA